MCGRSCLVIRWLSYVWWFIRSGNKIKGNSFSSYRYSSIVLILTDCLFSVSISAAKTSWLFQPQSAWLPCLQTSWRDCGYERFALVLETNCKRKPKGQLPSSSYNHNTLKTLSEGVFTNAFQSCTCNQVREVQILWGFSVYCGYKMNLAAAPWVALCN